MFRCFQYSSAYRSLDEPPDDLSAEEENSLRGVQGELPVSSVEDESCFSRVGTTSTTALQQRSLSAQRSSPLSSTTSLFPVNQNRVSPADLNRLSPLSVSSTGAEGSSRSEQHLQLVYGGSTVANLGGHLGGSTGTLSANLSNLLSPPAPPLGGSLAGTHSAPGSTAGFTPELKRPPNHKYVKHLEATLLKNSFSDSQLNRRQRDEERYIRVSIGAHLPGALSGTPGAQQVIPPPRPTVPCPKRDKKSRELVARLAPIDTTERWSPAGLDKTIAVKSTGGSGSNSVRDTNTNEVKGKDNQLKEIKMGGRTQVIRVPVDGAPLCWAPPVPGQRLSVVQESVSDCLEVTQRSQKLQYSQKFQQLPNECNEKTHDSSSVFKGPVHLPQHRHHLHLQPRNVPFTASSSARLPIRIVVGGTTIIQDADTYSGMVGDQTSADNRLASFAVSPINGNNEAFGINEVCSVNQRRPAAFSGEVPLAKAGRFLPTQSSSCRVNTIRNQDQFHPVQQRAQITSSTTTSFSTISSARNASSRLISAASRKCRMAPPSNSSNILDNASGTSAGTGCLGGATGALGATNVSGSTTTTAAAAAGGGGGGSSSSRNWLHQDNEILGQGVCYTVKYVGCLEVLTSMKSLDFDTRTLIAKECIVRVCESAGLRSADRKRKIDRRLNRVLAEKPIMEHAGANVSLRINSSSLSLTDLETNQSVASHSMPNISFASGGDQDTLDFVAYVGKDARQSRACFVLECGGGLAQEVIATIGQAFELRFRELMRRSPVVQGSNCATSSGSGSGPAAPPFVPLPPKDPDYYNDLPGKTPPEHHRPLPMSNVVSAAPPSGDGSSPINNNNTAAMKPSGDNLIDFENSDPIPDHPAPPPNHEYVNQSIINNTLDVFDMRPMDQVLSPATSTLTQQSGTQSQIPITGPPQQIAHIAADTGETQTLSQAPDSNQAPPPYVVASIEQHLLMEPWYHGAISRAESEKLLARDGDFLVRESRGQRGQFVLTGLQAGQGRHLLLIDPHGVVRTKDRTFSSVSHLIHFHRDNQLPILSADSALLLVRPIMHSKFAGPVGATGNSTHGASMTSTIHSSQPS